MQSIIELELSRGKVIQTDYALLKQYYWLTDRGPDGHIETTIAQNTHVDRVALERDTTNFITFLATRHPQLQSICKDLDEVIDMLYDNTIFDKNTVQTRLMVQDRLMNILEILKEAGECLSVTGEYITRLGIGWSIVPPPPQHYWNDDNLLKEAYDLISEFIEREFS